MESIRLSRIGDSPSEFALGNSFGIHVLLSVRANSQGCVNCVSAESGGREMSNSSTHRLYFHQWL